MATFVWEPHDVTPTTRMTSNAHDGRISGTAIAYFLSYSNIFIGHNLSGPAGCGFVMGNFSILLHGGAVAQKKERGIDWYQVTGALSDFAHIINLNMNLTTHGYD